MWKTSIIYFGVSPSRKNSLVRQYQFLQAYILSKGLIRTPIIQMKSFGCPQVSPMNSYVIGNKSELAVEAVIYSDIEIQKSDLNSVYWGEGYPHGFLTLCINDCRFGERGFIYPLDPTINDALENPFNEKDYPGLMECGASDLIDAFNYAKENRPQVDFPEDVFTGDSKEEALRFANSGSAVDKYMPDFLREFAQSDELSDCKLLIGSYALKKLEIIRIKTDGKVRLVVKDEQGKVESIVVSEKEYYSIWNTLKKEVDAHINASQTK